jgi:hypothetical protein
LDCHEFRKREGEGRRRRSRRTRRRRKRRRRRKGRPKGEGKMCWRGQWTKEGNMIVVYVQRTDNSEIQKLEHRFSFPKHMTVQFVSFASLKARDIAADKLCLEKTLFVY